MSDIIRFVPLVDWQPVELPKWSVNGFGMDSCSVLWRGPRTTREAFMRRLDETKWESMLEYRWFGDQQWPAYPSMYRSDYSEGNGTPNYPGIQLTFLGLKDGVVRTAKSNDTTSLQSAQGTGTDTSTGMTVTGSFTYRASRTNWSWTATTTPPDTAPEAYTVVNSQLDPFNSITGYSIQNADTGKPINSVPYSAFVAVFNSLVKARRVSEYTRELIVPGKYWACSTTVDYALTTPGT